MPDQADKLRELVQLQNGTHYADSIPPMVLVSGGKGGVGTTTVATHLAGALSRKDLRVALVDANLQHADVLDLLGMEEQPGKSLIDVVLQDTDIIDAFRAGPCDLMVLGGESVPSKQLSASSTGGERLVAQLPRLADLVDLLVVDVGTGINAWSEPLWRAAQLVLLVTTTDDVSVVDAYGKLKIARQSRVATPIRILVNQELRPLAARETHVRIAETCRRFLGESIAVVPPLPAKDASESAWDDAVCMLAEHIARTAIDHRSLVA